MTHAPSARRTVLLALRWLLGGAPAVVAQTAVVAHTDAAGGQLCVASLFVSGGSNAGTGCGFALCELQNLDDRPHRVDLRLGSQEWDGSDVEVVWRAELAANATDRRWLPVAVPPTDAIWTVGFDGTNYRSSVSFDRGAPLLGALVSDRPEVSGGALDLLREALGSSGGTLPAMVPVRAEQVPADWRWLTGFAAVVVDGRAALHREQQAALFRYLQTGGRVVVANPDRLPAGELRQVAMGSDAVVHSGFGELVVVERLGAGALPIAAARGRLLWPASSDWFEPQDIEGIGEAPVGAFVLVIVLFAIVAGPVNLLLLRRRRKPMLALATVPALGFGTTLWILGYGAFHDGFGVRGVVASWTSLDQVRHEAAALAARTLFTGLPPESLPMPADRLWLSGRAGLFDRDRNDRWHYDADGQHLDGGVLPSRTITPLLAAQHGAVRERLQVRRAGDELQVLADGGVAPVGTTVLRDLAGDYWLGDGVLRRVPAAEAELRLAALAAVATTLVARIRSDERAVGASATLTVPQPLARRLEPGSYLTAVSVAPWLDEAGLAVEYGRTRHFVHGRMDPTDFLP